MTSVTSLADVAPSFVAMAHRIVWATVATVGVDGRPRTRILHPLWEWDGHALVGWILTSPLSPKRADLDANPSVSLTYWVPEQDTCTADAAVEWVLDDEGRRAAWERFSSTPEPVGYDPSIIPAWIAPTVDAFGALRLTPTWLRVMPGSVLLRGEGEVITWQAASSPRT